MRAERIREKREQKKEAQKHKSKLDVGGGGADDSEAERSADKLNNLLFSEKDVKEDTREDDAERAADAKSKFLFSAQ